MQNYANRVSYSLLLRSSSWLKDSHSLFDYQSQKLDNTFFTFPLNTRSVSIYRKKQSSTVIALDDYQQLSSKTDLEEFQFLTRFQIKTNLNSHKIRLEFSDQKIGKLKKVSSQRLNTDESNSGCENKQEDTYIIVKKNKDINNSDQEGYELAPGQTIKLGRVEYFVSEAQFSGAVIKAPKIGTSNFNSKVLKLKSQQQIQGHAEPKNPCKICLEEVETTQNFLFNPCLCTGSCGTVHIDCLATWIDVKVKKQTIGGTIHLNFDKFECQVCKFELPMIIQSNNKQKQLLHLEKPQGNYLILEGACEKTKSVMLIQNVPNQGIKLGRGHQCQIRITDISVSRSHACIKSLGNSFRIYDNKSKFGTLIKPEPLVIELDKMPKGIQIGRTVIYFTIQKHIKESKPQKLLLKKGPSQ